MGLWFPIMVMIKLSQPSLAGVSAGAELGKIKHCKKMFSLNFEILNIVTLRGVTYS